MKHLTFAFIVCLFIPVTGIPQIKIEASQEERTEVSSPMTVTAPIVKTMPQFSSSYSVSLFKIEELSTTVCDAVILKSVSATVLFNKKRTKGELTMWVTTYTEPPKDKTAFVSLLIRNDDEILRMPTAQYPRYQSATLKINAEEEKTRMKSKTVKIDPAQLDKILSGINPRVEITLRVENN